MRKVILIMFTVLLFTLLAGCGISENELKDVAGDWVGNLGIDGSGNEIEISASNHYDLWIDQNTNFLTASLTFPPEFDIDSPIALSGTIYGNEVKLNGSYNDSEVSVDGIVDEEDSLQIAVKGIGSEIYHVLLLKKEFLLEASFNNSYELEKKLGTSGNGRSIILVHGMDDNAKSWDDMLDYFDDHGISKTNNVWVFQYKWELKIADNGATMKSMINDKQSDGDITKDPIIIAHSMGGLVARSYISKGGDFHRLVTLGTPHLGSGLANLTYIFNWAGVTGVADLAPGSNFLDALNSDSYEQSQRSKYTLLNGKVGKYWVCEWTVCVFDKCKCMAGHHNWHDHYPFNIKLGYKALSKPNDGMVPQSSARFYGDNDVHHVSSFEWIDHISLNKNSRVCKWVTDFIQGL